MTLPVLPMPSIRPVPIPVKGLPFWKKGWALLTAVRRFEVTETWFFIMPDGQVIIIPRGFIFDGASTPKFMWGILDPVGILLIQGLVHDYGYRHDYLWAFDKNRVMYKLHLGAGRLFWDDMFLKIGLDLYDMQVTGYLSYAMLRLFGWIAWNKNRDCQHPDIIIDY